MVWKVYFVNTCVIVSYFRHFHHVTLDQFDVYLHAWLYVYNMERRGVRFDHIYDEIDACLVWFRVLRTKLIFRQLFVAEFPFIIKNPTETVFHRVLKVSTYIGRNTNFMFPKQRLYRPKQWLCTNAVSAKPCLYRVQFFMENSVFAYCIHTFRVGTDPVFSKIQRFGIFDKNRLWQSLYRACTGPVRVFWKFRTDSIPALYRAIFDAVTARLQTARVKKVSIPTPGHCTLSVHCRYIACFSRCWACWSRYSVC